MTETASVDGAVARDVRAFIQESFLYMRPGLELKDDDDLLGQGIVDSLGFVELVEEVQTRYGITIEDVEITEENLGSVSAIVRFVSAKRPA